MSDEKDRVLHDETWASVSRVINACQKAEDKMDEIANCAGILPESPLLDCPRGAMSTAVCALEELIGDHFEILSWYCWENDYGRNALEYSVGSSGPMIPVRTLDDLRVVVEAAVAENVGKEQ